jgi:hypothetical protein
LPEAYLPLVSLVGRTAVLSLYGVIANCSGIKKPGTSFVWIQKPTETQKIWLLENKRFVSRLPWRQNCRQTNRMQQNTFKWCQMPNNTHLLQYKFCVLLLKWALANLFSWAICSVLCRYWLYLAKAKRNTRVKKLYQIYTLLKCNKVAIKISLNYPIMFFVQMHQSSNKIRVLNNNWFYEIKSTKYPGLN